MSSNTKTITAPAKEHDQSVREPNAVLQNKKSDKHFVWAEKELAKVSEKKSDIIKELAKRLDAEKEIDKTRISTEIAKRLSGYVTDRYVQEILPDKYKIVYRVNNAKSSRTSSPNQAKSGIPQQQKNLTGTAISIVPVDTVTKAQKLENNVKVDQERETKHGIVQFDPQQYLLQDLHTYNHEMLESIVKWLHEHNANLVKALKNLDKENRLLKQENQKLRQGVKTK